MHQRELMRRSVPTRSTTPVDLGRFVTNAIRRPNVTGGVLPTSNVLADSLARVIPTEGNPTVLELGPGTGALSAAIQRRLPHGARYVGIEIDSAMVRHLRTTRPWLEVIHGDVAETESLLASTKIDQVDTVISGLPWSLFSDDQQRRILSQVANVLQPHGTFTTIAYVTALRTQSARAFRRRLESTFDEVLLTNTVWRNVPPARNYVCRRPNIRASRH